MTAAEKKVTELHGIPRGRIRNHAPMTSPASTAALHRIGRGCWINLSSCVSILWLLKIEDEPRSRRSEARCYATTSECCLCSYPLLCLYLETKCCCPCPWFVARCWYQTAFRS